jgi:hypothetical protein
MYMFINALILAMLLPGGAASKAQDGPACQAELRGTNLLTTFRLPDGVIVEGPWRIMHFGSMENGEAHFTMLAILDHVVEKDVLTGHSNVIPFPQPIRLAFEGTTQKEMVQRAAQVWCVTVQRAQENRALDQISPDQARNKLRIAALPQAVLAAL